MVFNQAKLHKPFRSKNVFREVQTCKNLPKESQAIVQKYIPKNAYFAHPEHILTCMNSDDNEEIRKRAVQILINIERNKRRKFLVQSYGKN